ncbi:reticulophagy regulator 1 isoform X1 [Gadus chalcogrammus]|uniref:reticulophagy regulator 1 isoform X1 n=1 Tax=Gadus chalcogrammus TaxID=1042646 RepID=UPI0024C4B3EE|nr:reticulophagy regulator 1 isoform X1 [Gadus chalcogrammus]
MFSMASHERTESSAGGEDDAAAAAGPGGRGGRPVGGGQADGEPEPEARAWWLAAPRRLWSSVNWRRGARTAALFAAVNSAFWFVAFSTGRVYCLLSLSLAGAVTVATLKEAVILSESRVMDLWSRVTRRWKLMDPGESGGSETEPPVSQAFKLFLQETSSFKQQNPGKFCLLVCSLCTFFAVLGRYIPGIVVSYVLILGVFLWPLISSQEFALWLKPVLQKLDFGVGQFLQRIKDNHERRLLQATSEKESIEADLSSLFPKLDSTACKEMSVSDTEVSDVTWTDNGTFNLSEGHTPQTDNSEDLDKEEAFIGGLPEFPSLDNGAGTNGDDDDDLSIGLPTPPTRARRPIRSKHTSAAPPRRDPTDQAMDLVNQMASDAIAAAVTAAIQERIEAAVGMAIPAEVLAMSRSRRPECNTALLPIALAGESESDSEVEDFELLDQSELEQLDKELGLAVRSQLTQEEGPSPEATPGNEASSPGFFSKLLGRH